MDISILNGLPSPPDDRTGWPWTEQTPNLPNTMPNGEAWPRISIVTPSFNQGQFIEETIRSILLQGYPDLEYIVIDGGSTDNSVDIIEKYEPWLTHWVSEKDEGQAHAINKGMTKASGEIRAYINSDDYYCPHAFEKVALLLNASESDLFSGIVAAYPGEGHYYFTGFPRFKDWINSIFRSLAQPGTFWRYSPSLPEFDESLHCVFDRKFFLELIYRQSKIYYCDQVVAVFRLHDGSKTSNLEDRFFQENMRVNYELLTRLPEGEQLSVKRHLQFAEDRHRVHQLKHLKMSWNDLRIVCQLILSIFSWMLRNRIVRYIKRSLTITNPFK